MPSVRPCVGSFRTQQDQPSGNGDQRRATVVRVDYGIPSGNLVELAVVILDHLRWYEGGWHTR
jgi:hypothetical protein